MKIQWKSATIPHFLAERRSIFFSVETQVRVSLNCWVTSTIWCPALSIQAVRDLLLWVWQLILPRILRHDRWYYKRKFFIHVENLSSSQLTLCCDIHNNLNYTTAQRPNWRKGGRNSLPRLSDLENQYRRKYRNFRIVKTIFPANCKISQQSPIPTPQRLNFAQEMNLSKNIVNKNKSIHYSKFKLSFNLVTIHSLYPLGGKFPK